MYTHSNDFHQSARKIHGFPSTTMMVLFRHLLYIYNTDARAAAAAAAAELDANNKSKKGRGVVL
jgi:hypothetical protein